MSMLRVGALAYPVTAPQSFAAFAEKFEQLVAQGAADDAHLLVMPEYACMELAAASPHAGDVAHELAFVCAARAQLMRLFQTCAVRHKVWLLPGTLPWQDGDLVRNRAPLISPDGTVRFQDKRVMTRFEKEQWQVQAGSAPAVFSTPCGHIGIAICYDSEFPNLVRAQAASGATLILVPSCTDTLHGFNRVRLSARARALENQCYVAMAPTVGSAPRLATLDENHGYAAVFGPIDRGFPADGVLAQGSMDEPGWVFADCDMDKLARVREEGAVRNFFDWPADPPPPGVHAEAGEAA